MSFKGRYGFGLLCALLTLAALVLDAPVTIVCLCIQTENVCKMPLGVLRLRSRKWINDITRGGAAA